MQDNFDLNLQKAFEFLVTTQNADGGWGYRRGGMSYVEPTAFALLSLFSVKAAGGQNVADNRFQAVVKGLNWLRSQQHEDGGWGVMRDDPTSGWMTYPVVWMLHVLLKTAELTSYYGRPEDRGMMERGRGWILSKGREPAVDQATNQQVKKLFQIESDYRGFGWGAGEAGWVIPTSLALIALTVEDPPTIVLTPEVINGKDYLRDRACPDGGWNVGNPWMLGKKLPPTADATSFALVAWRICLTAADLGSNTEVVNTGLAYLQRVVETTNSDHSLALATWATTLYKEQADRTSYRVLLANGLENERSFQYRGQEFKKKTLAGQDKTTGGWVNSPYTTAIATFALTDNRYYLEPK